MLRYENKEVADSMLRMIKADIKEGQLQWNDFLKFLRVMLAKNFSEKLELFFQTYDLDRNSCFDWSEVKKICGSCLASILTREDEFSDSLAESFT